MYLNILNGDIRNVPAGTLWVGSDELNAKVYGIITQDGADRYFVNLTPVVKSNNQTVMAWRMPETIAGNRFSFSAVNEVRFEVNDEKVSKDFVGNALPGSIVAGHDGAYLCVFYENGDGRVTEFVNLQTFERTQLENTLRSAIFVGWRLLARVNENWETVCST